jgi:hypothetical protein
MDKTLTRSLQEELSNLFASFIPTIRNLFIQGAKGSIKSNLLFYALGFRIDLFDPSLLTSLKNVQDDTATV